MEIEGRKHVVLYLTDWQMRMVKDLTGVDTHVWTVPVGSAPVLRYMGPGARSSPAKAKRMYLTETQRKEVKDIAGEDCEFVELDSNVVVKYMAPPPMRAR